MQNKIFKRILIPILILILTFALGYALIAPLSLYNTSSEFAQAESNEDVYIGGTPIGIIAKSDGFIITKFINVPTTEDSVGYSPAQKSGLQVGDYIVQVDGRTISDIVELNKYISSSKDSIIFNVKRGGKLKKVTVTPLVDSKLKTKKIGMMVNNDVSGIGTLTFIKDDNYYGALGHFVSDEFGNTSIYQNGRIFAADINGYKVGKKGMAGELKGTIKLNKNIGTITANRTSGLTGKINEDEKKGRAKYPIGHRNEVVVGEASIYTTIDANPPQFYKIEIIKTETQDSIKDKSMVIRVTDQGLKEKTGGILQGMSGSPIVQNNKIVGAVTHVFLNDATLGYGIYTDWMI